MPRFYFDSKSVRDGTVLLDSKESRHAHTVLRLKAGDAVDLMDGAGQEFTGVVIESRGGRLAVALGAGSKTPAAPFSFALAVSVIRSERMELLIQKSCELGVSAIFPLLTERSIVRLSKERWEAKVSRWKKIAMESCKQCGQSKIPSISPVQFFKDFFSRKLPYEKILIPTLAVSGATLYSSLQSAPSKNILALVGPEGDFSKKEAELAISHQAVPVTLGKLVMRSETAAIYLLSALNFYYGEIDPRDKEHLRNNL